MLIVETEMKNHLGFYCSRTVTIKRTRVNMRDFKKRTLQKFGIKWAGRDKENGVQNQFCPVIHGHRAKVSHTPGPISWMITPPKWVGPKIRVGRGIGQA